MRSCASNISKLLSLSENLNLGMWIYSKSFENLSPLFMLLLLSDHRMNMLRSRPHPAAAVSVKRREVGRPAAHDCNAGLPTPRSAGALDKRGC